MNLLRPAALARVATVGLVASVPALVTVLLAHLSLDANLADFTPGFWNDQVGYWHRIASFAEVGLDTGYYSPDEVEPPFEAVRFGVNGPWFPATYGTIGALVGWGPATSIFVNMAVLAVGLVGFIRLADLDTRGALLTGVVCAAFWPLVLYVPTASQESLQQALAMLLAGIFVRALRKGPELGTAEKIGGLALILTAGIFRYSWLLLLPCLALLTVGRFTLRRVLAAGAITATALLVVMRSISALQPPGANAPLDTLKQLATDPADSAGTFVETTWTNVELFLYPGALDPTAPTFRERGSLDVTGVQSWMLVGLTVLSALALIASRRRVQLPRAIRAIPPREALFHLINLGVMTATAFALYIPNGYYRVLGAHLLLSMLIFVAFRRVAIVGTIVALNLLMFPSFLDAYGRWKPNFHLDQAMLARDRAAFARLVKHERDARNPWCNTLLLPLSVYDWRVTLIPPGIGVSYALGGGVAQPKSRYLLLDDQLQVDRSRLMQLGSFPGVALYENPDSLCFTEGAA